MQTCAVVPGNNSDHAEMSLAQRFILFRMESAEIWQARNLAAADMTAYKQKE